MDGALTPVFATIAAALLAVAGGCVIMGVADRERQQRIRRQIDRVTVGRPGEPEVPFLRRLGVAVGRHTLWRTRDVQELTQLMHGAGFFSPVAAYQFVALQVFAAVSGASFAAGAAAGTGMTSAQGVLVAVASAVIGYFLPRLALRLLAARRLHAIRREIPFLIDMLLLLLRSGAGFERCFREIEHLGGEAIPTSHRAVELLISDLDQGRGYDVALERWADRMSDPSASEIARQLKQAIAHGTELSRAMSQFSEHLIAQRLASGREKAGRRSTHMTVAALLFFMPPLIIVLAAPGFSSVIRLMTGN